MRRVGATRIYTSSVNFLHNYILEIDGRCVVGYLPLTHETPMTEWLQGVIVVSDVPGTIAKDFTNISEFFSYGQQPDAPLHAWHITKMDYATGFFDGTPHIL